MNWTTMLSYVTGSVNEALLRRNEYLVAENRILRAQIPGRVNLTDGDRRTLAEIGKRLGRQALAEIASIVGPETILAQYRRLGGDLAWQVADGSNPAEMLLERPMAQYPKHWSPDGRLLIFDDSHPTDGYDIWALPLDGEPYPLVATPANELNGEISPDGRWLTCDSDTSGRVEVYVRPFPDVSELRVPISTSGAIRPFGLRMVPRSSIWSANP